MEVIKPPNSIALARQLSVFLAGSIEMGTADDWQASLQEALADLPGTIFNPRRNDWNHTWEQSIENAEFRQQVRWELAALEASALTVLYFHPGTKSPISLLEFGLYSRDRKLVVCCPEGFWRKGNVDVVCELYNVTQVDDLPALTKFVRDFIESKVK
jgi:hypothetical protein